MKNILLNNIKYYEVVNELKQLKLEKKIIKEI